VLGGNGRLLETWTGAARAYGVLAAMGKIFGTGQSNPGRLYRIDPSQPAGAVTTVATNLGANPAMMAFDGSRDVWVTDLTANTLLKLDANAAVLQTVTVGSGPKFPIYDGTNIWVPNIFDSTVTAVRVSNGAVLATLTGNGLSFPNAAAFDGQRVLVTNEGDNVSLWKAADLTPLGSAFTGASTVPTGACSDGVSFWITLSGPARLARF
jgi:hypothetical protein